jgi:hypothetical protein
MPQVIFILATFWIGLNCSAAFAQHPAEHQAIHEKFYSTWMMPDAPYVSCCHNEDCSPAESKVENGNWYARKSDDDEWIQIPASKVEHG